MYAARSLGLRDAAYYEWINGRFEDLDGWELRYQGSGRTIWKARSPSFSPQRTPSVVTPTPQTNSEEGDREREGGLTLDTSSRSRSSTLESSSTLSSGTYRAYEAWADRLPALQIPEGSVLRFDLFSAESRGSSLEEVEEEVESESDV